MLPSLAFECAEFASTSGGADILRAYIDPGVAGFIIVTVLGFISSIGYWARSHIGRVKQRLFGRGKDCAADHADGKGSEDGNTDGEGANC